MQLSGVGQYLLSDTDTAMPHQSLASSGLSDQGESPSQRSLALPSAGIFQAVLGLKVHTVKATSPLPRASMSSLATGGLCNQESQPSRRQHCRACHTPWRTSGTPGVVYWVGDIKCSPQEVLFPQTPDWWPFRPKAPQQGQLYCHPLLLRVGLCPLIKNKMTSSSPWPSEYLSSSAQSDVTEYLFQHKQGSDTTPRPFGCWIV